MQGGPVNDDESMLQSPIKLGSGIQSPSESPGLSSKGDDAEDILNQTLNASTGLFPLVVLDPSPKITQGLLDAASAQGTPTAGAGIKFRASVENSFFSVSGAGQINKMHGTGASCVLLPPPSSSRLRIPHASYSPSVHLSSLIQMAPDKSMASMRSQRGL